MTLTKGVFLLILIYKVAVAAQRNPGSPVDFGRARSTIK